jgi:hypothetical protein
LFISLKSKTSTMNNSKMFLVTILSITTVLLATSAFTPLASAQNDNQGGQGQGPPGQGYQGQGGQGYQGHGGQGFQGQGFHGTRTAVNGTYTNSNYGVQVTLPDGWSGFEMKQQSGNARVMIAPGGYQMTQGATRPPVTIGISIMPSSSTQPQMMARSMQGVTCTNSTTTNTVNSLNLNVLTRDCTGTDANGNAIEMKSKTETTQANSANIVLSFRANPASGYDSQVGNFDNMVNTLQISTPTTSPQTTTSSASTSIPTPVNPVNPTNPAPIPTPPGAPAAIPKWVKGIFGMYAQGQLSDNDLVQALQFLIKQGIIRVQ